MNIEKMITRATETILDLDAIEDQFLLTTECEEFYPKLKAAEDQYHRVYETLHSTLDAEQRKLLIALDDQIGNRLGAETQYTLIVGLIVGLKYAGFSDERIKATLTAVLPDLEMVTTTDSRPA